jgi:hypothetical protein
MLKIALNRSENGVRAEFPNAVAEIKNFQLQNDRISFELQFYADAEARQMITKPVGVEPAFIENGGIVARKHFSEAATVIEAYEADESATTLTGKLISCCYQWLTDKHYPAAVTA